MAYQIQVFTAGALLLLGLLLISVPAAYGTNCIKSKEMPKECLSENNPHITKEFTVDDNATLRAYTASGNIEVQTVENTDKVRVELYLDRGYSFWSNNKNLDNYRITIIQRGNEVVASVERKSKETGFFSDQMRFSYKIYVPKKLSTELKTARGNVTISGMQGNHVIKSSGGNIDLESISGKASVYTAGGNITISNSRGVLYGKTTGGNINIAQSQGEIRVQSSAGQVIAERISGTLLAELGAGDIKAHFTCVSEGISLNTGAGNIYVELPFRDGYDLVINGSEIDLPSGLDFSGYRNSRRVEGRVAGGGAPINLTTSHGNIILKNK